jgi:hypothetical protein
MKLSVVIFCSVLCSMFLAACATQLTTAGSQVRTSHSAEEVLRCKRIKSIYENRASGSDGIADATRGALNDAAAAGANTIYIESSSMGARGSSVVATAYQCQ